MIRKLLLWYATCARHYPWNPTLDATEPPHWPNAENWFALGAGALLLFVGVSRRSVVGACLAMSSTPLLYRGVTGRWPPGWWIRTLRLSEPSSGGWQNYEPEARESMQLSGVRRIFAPALLTGCPDAVGGEANAKPLPWRPRHPTQLHALDVRESRFECRSTPDKGQAERKGCP